MPRRVRLFSIRACCHNRSPFILAAPFILIAIALCRRFARYIQREIRIGIPFPRIKM